jgi:hypothetical protein
MNRLAGCGNLNCATKYGEEIALGISTIEIIIENWMQLLLNANNSQNHLESV